MVSRLWKSWKTSKLSLNLFSFEILANLLYRNVQFWKVFLLDVHFFKKWNTLHKKCLYSDFFWSAFSHIWSFSRPCPVWLQENTDQKNSEHGHFSGCYSFGFTLSVSLVHVVLSELFSKGSLLINSRYLNFRIFGIFYTE